MMTKAAEAVIAELKEYYGGKRENAGAIDPLRVFGAADVFSLDMHPVRYALELVSIGGNKDGIINEEAVVAKAVCLIDAALEEFKEVREILRRHLPAGEGQEDCDEVCC